MQILQRKNYLAVEDRTIDAGQFVGVLAVLDDINFAVRYCDSLCLLIKGKLGGHGQPGLCINPDVVGTLWGHRPQRLVAEDGVAVYC